MTIERAQGSFGRHCRGPQSEGLGSNACSGREYVSHGARGAQSVAISGRGVLRAAGPTRQESVPTYPVGDFRSLKGFDTAFRATTPFSWPVPPCHPRLQLRRSRHLGDQRSFDLHALRIARCSVRKFGVVIDVMAKPDSDRRSCPRNGRACLGKFRGRGFFRCPRNGKWWRRRESNPRPQALHYRTYMLSPFFVSRRALPEGQGRRTASFRAF
jgi:hypothetical protein